MKQHCFRNEWERIWKRYVLLLFVFLMGTWGSTASAQSSTLTGHVKDDAGEPIPGVSVLLKGTNNGTMTDPEGRYELSGVPSDAVIVFSLIGMKPLEIVVGNRTSLDIIMERESIALEGVVAIGYGSMRKEDVTGAIASVSREEILANPSVSALQSIQGKAAGVDIYSTSQKPGDAPSIRIRGNRSIKASNSPLYVIDGIPFLGSLNDINSSDIESIDILKDASATAIYGSRGANGVVVITTRRGKAGKASISYSGYYGVQTNYDLDIMNAEEFTAFRREARRNAGKYDSDVPDLELDKNMFYYPDKYVIESISAAYDENGNYDPSKIQSYDWPDAITRLGVIEDHQLSIRGGSENSKISFSAGYFNNKGTTQGFGYHRYTLRMTLDQEVKDWLRFGATMASSFNTKNESGNVNKFAYQTNPLNPLYDENGVLQLTPGGELTPNAKLVAENDIISHRSNNFYGSYFAEIDILKGLKYRLNFGPDYKEGRSGYFYGSRGSRLGADPTASESTFRQFHYTLDNLIYFDKTFSNIHTLSLTALHSFEQFTHESLNGSVEGLPYEYQKWFNLGTATSISGLGSSYSMWRLNSFMARVNYSFKDKYLATITGRADGSSRLAEKHKYSFFPSIAFSWRVIEEPFMRESALFDNLKLRIGYGVTGNTSISPYETLGSLSRTTYASDDAGFLGYAPNLLYNPDLSWEKTRQYNIGLDFSLLNNRLSGTIDVYRQNTKDLLLPRQLPIASGFSSLTQNIGATRNSGIEASLSADIVQNRDGFNWHVDLIFYSNKEEIVRLYAENRDDVGNKWFLGYPVNTFYDYKFDGIWQNTEGDNALMVEYNENGSNYAPGEIRVYDRDGDRKITAADRMILGSAVPKWTGSLNSSMSYKGWDFSFFLFTRQGQMIYDTMDMQYEGRYNWLNVDYWTPDNPSNSWPRPVDGRMHPLNYQTLLYQDGSFLKLKTVTLGYTFSSSLLSKLDMSRLRIYLTAQNPIMRSPFRGIDPEGATGLSMPSVRTYMMGIAATF